MFSRKSFLASLLGGSAIAAASPGPVAHEETKWEYMCIDLSAGWEAKHGSDVASLNILGIHGWELVSVARSQYSTTAYLKRKLQ